MPLEYGDRETERLLRSLYDNGFTQEGVNALYARLGLSNPPTVPVGLIGNRPGSGRAGIAIFDANGRRVGSRTGEIGDFLNTFGRQAMDPYREYGVGNYLGLAGLALGAAGAGGAFNGLAGGSGAGSTGALAGSGAPATTGGMVTSSGLGAFAPGSSIGTMATSNAGLLASSGAITGGAGVAGIGALNSLAGGSGMGWNWDTLLDYGVPLVGSWLEGEGSKDAARAQSQASAAAIAENRRQFDTSREDMLPWLTAGRNALGRLEDPNAFTASPSYNFVRGEGMRGIENSFAARGGAASGNALRALAEFNSGLASQEHGNWWNQQAGLAGVGQTAGQNLGVLGANNAANIGGLMQNQGNARASGIAGRTNAYTNLLSNLASVYNRRNG